MPFRLVRTDASPGDTMLDGRQPDGEKKMDHLRDVLYRMALTDKDTTVLSGAHTLSRALNERPGFADRELKLQSSLTIRPLSRSLRMIPIRNFFEYLQTLPHWTSRSSGAGERYASDQQAFIDDHVQIATIAFNFTAAIPIHHCYYSPVVVTYTSQ